MPVQLHWDQHDLPILIFDLRDNWSWDEYHAGVEMIGGLPYPVYAIVLPSLGFPPSASILSHFNHVVRQLPPNLALIVVVMDNFFIETINQVFFRISPLGRRIGRAARTIEEARHIVAEYDAKHGTVSS